MTGPAGRWVVGGASARGAAHERRNAPNQDALGWLPTGGTGRQVVASVADGHGAPVHHLSDIGAMLAVQGANAVLDWFLSDGPSDQAAAELPTQIVAAWQQAVQSHAAAATGRPWVEPLADTLLAYGSTLVSLAANGSTVLALQIGDGDLYVGYPDGRIDKPLADDRGLIGEQTYSLCALDAARRFRVAVLRPAPGAPMPDFAFLATDGLSKSFTGEKGVRTLVGHYRTVLLTTPMADVARSLPAWLSDLSRRGSGDDVTLCLAIRAGAAQDTAQDAAQDTAQSVGQEVR